MNNLVSIVIPIYNSEKYLSEAIESCLNQTYSNIEVITVNDGSTDNTFEILKNYEDKVLIKSQINKGVSAATNLGIRYMKGDLFKIMNADDVLYPECIESLVNEFNKVNNKKTIIHADGEIIDEHGRIVEEFYHINYNNLSQFDQNVILLYRNMVTNISSIFHSSVFSHCGLYDETLRSGVDYELWLRTCVQFNYKLHLLSKKLVKWRVVKNEGITASVLKENPNYGENIRNLVLKRLDVSARTKYEQALDQYIQRKKTPLKTKPKKIVSKILRKLFSSS